MAFVDHHQRAVTLGQVANPVELRNRAIHRKHAVGDDQRVALAGRSGGLQLRFQIRHVVVLVAVARRLAQPDAVDDRCMIQRIRDDRVLLVEQRLEHAAIGIECRRIQNRVFHSEKIRQRALQLLVDGLRAANEAHRRQPVTVLLGRRDRCLHRGFVARQAQIVVGAQIDQAAAVVAHHFGALARRQHPLRLVQALLAQTVEFCVQVIDK